MTDDSVTRYYASRITGKITSVRVPAATTRVGSTILHDTPEAAEAAVKGSNR